MKKLRSSVEPPKALTIRQWRILSLVAAGVIYKEIGTNLGITERTVKYHMGRIIDKLGVENRSQAIGRAQRHLDQF